MDDVSQRFPLLHAPERWDWAAMEMRFSTELPPDELVQSVHVIGFVGDRVVVCRDERPDVWFLPGGTREPGEGLGACLTRELQEEAGARLLGPFVPIGAHIGRYESPKPYRPHLPHPRAAWLWGYADVVVDGAPTSPADGEQIAEVRIVDAGEARRLLVTDNVWGAELLDLALAVRGASGG